MKKSVEWCLVSFEIYIFPFSVSCFPLNTTTFDTVLTHDVIHSHELIENIWEIFCDIQHVFVFTKEHLFATRRTILIFVPPEMFSKLWKKCKPRAHLRKKDQEKKDSYPKKKISSFMHTYDIPTLYALLPSVKHFFFSCNECQGSNVILYITDFHWMDKNNWSILLERKSHRNWMTWSKSEQQDQSEICKKKTKKNLDYASQTFSFSK